MSILLLVFPRPSVPLPVKHSLLVQRAQQRVQEESSLCDLLLDSERDSGAGTSLCGSSTGGSSSQRRRASAPFGLHHPHHPAQQQHWHPLATHPTKQHIGAPSLQHHHSSTTTTYRPHSHQQQQQVGITTATGPAVVGAVRRSPRGESAKTFLPIGQSKRRAVLLEVRKMADMATTSAESVATPTPPKEKVIIGSRTTTGTDGEGTAGAAATTEMANGGGVQQQTTRPKDDRDQFLLAQSQPSTSGTVIPLAQAVDNNDQQLQQLQHYHHQQQQQQCTSPACRHHPKQQEGHGSPPSVFISLAKSGEDDDRRHHWWHWRNGVQSRLHLANGNASAADHRSMPSIFVLGEEHNEKTRDGYTRKWTAHTGQNRFFCDGRFMLARQSSVFLLTLFLILFTMALFCLYDLPYLTEHVSLLIPAVSLLIFLFVMATLFKTAFSDPGIVPRASPREVLEWERQCQETDPYFNADEWAQPRTRVVNIRGQPVKLKYCFTCSIFRPPRSSHCSICDNCVLNFDHHCPWVGNCIGLRNYRHFYLFISSLSVLDAFLGVSVGIHLYLLSLEKGSFVEAVKESPTSILTGLINIVSIWSVLGLSGFHTYLIALGQTTNEDIKGTFNRKLHPQVKNPYSSGNCVKNLVATLCAPERPSLLDRRGWMPPEAEGPAIFVDAALLDKLAAAKRRLPAHSSGRNSGAANCGVGAAANDGGGGKSMLAVMANGRAKGSGDEGRRRGGVQTTEDGGGRCSSASVVLAPPSIASPSSCPPSPPRQQRRNMATGAKADDSQPSRLNDQQQSVNSGGQQLQQQQQHCHRVIIPQSSVRNNNNSTGGIGAAPQQRLAKTTVPSTTTAMVAHRICHGNNLVAPVAADINTSEWTSSGTRGVKGRRSMTTNGNAKARGGDGAARRSPMSLVDEPQRSSGEQQCPTVWRRNSESRGEIARLGRGQGGEGDQQQNMEQNIC